MKVLELRDQLNKLIEEGKGGYEVMVYVSLDDGNSGSWEPFDEEVRPRDEERQVLLS